MSRTSRVPLLVSLALAAAGALADDTELYVTGFDAPARCEAPNVLFLIDTSGSMDSEVQTQAPWDPATSFAGCYDSDALYYSPTGELPGCDSMQRVPKADNRCAAAGEPLALVGRFRNLFRRWNPTRELWEPLEIGAEPGPVECEADRGEHGDGSGAVWAADGPAGPWAGQPDNEPAWGSAANVTLFDGNWLNWNSNPPSVTKTRLQVAQEVINSVLDSAERLNAGIMRFNYEEGGAVIQAVREVATERDEIKTVVSNLVADGFTPLSETLYEAGQYLAERNVDFGNVGPEFSVAASRIGNSPAADTYNSPMDAAGQKTYVVIITDGDPDRDSSADARIRALPGFAGLIGDDCDGSGEGRCLDDLAEYLFRRDLRADVPGTQNVITHTIGFNLDLELLESTASRGGGRYFVTEDTASLTAALTELAESFAEDGSLFTAPTIPVSSFDQTVSADDVYVALFEPSNRIRWPGNLKKYRLQIEEAGAGSPGEVRLVDRFDVPAVDPSTGFFVDGATSFWSEEPDGSSVRLGGAASRLPAPAERLLLTNVAGGDLNAPGGQNFVSAANPAITAALLGAPEAEREQVIAWARGRDVLDEDGDGDRDEPRLAMGDPLHSRPVVVSYGGTPDRPDSTVFVSTNEGYLHAVDADTGRELWAFVPAGLLPRTYSLYANNVSATRNYGLDGEITVHIAGNDGRPGIAAGERVILLFGMRRGGDGLFAVEVTERSRPRLLWTIDSATAGFADLGQTWSTPLVRRINVGGEVRSLVLFGGGYDTGQDNRSFREDSVGNAIFMVDLLTGERVWSAGRSGDHDLRLPAMRFSIPATLQTIDLNSDQRPDRIYVGDMGGQLWRFDIRNGNSAGELVAGGVVASLGAADLGADPPATEVRRFYNQADVVPVIEPGRIYLAVNIGSGYRAHPLDTTSREQFFSVRDFAVFDVIATDAYPPPVTVDELVDVTNDPDPLLDVDDAGWRFELVNGPGEKNLDRAATLNETVFFTSFTPAGNGDLCVPAGGINRLYQVSVRSGAPLTNLDNPLVDEPLTVDDRSRVLAVGGIAPAPVFLFSDEGIKPCVGLECFEPGELDVEAGSGGSTRPFIRSFWFQDESP